MERVDVVVIGAGVVGSATARALGRRGARAIVFDRFRIGHTRGSSHGATRIFRLSYPQADYVRLARRALVTWRALEDDANEELLLTTGGLDTGPTAADCAAALAACGVDHRWLRPEEATERFPSISFEGIDRALHQPDAGVCLADRVVAAQVRLARQAGVEVREETPVHGIAANHQGVVVETDAGQVEATVAVITAGPWAGPLLASALGSSSFAPPSLTPTLQQYAYFEPREGFRDSPMPTFVEWIGPGIASYAVPGGGAAPGIKVGDHDIGPVIDPADGPYEVDAERLRPIAEYVRRRLPGLVPEPIEPATCLYTLTPDEDFIVDRVGNLVIGAGFSGHGFKFGPLIGEMLADLATGREPTMPRARFSVARGTLRGR